MSVCHNQYRIELQSIKDALVGTGGQLVITEDKVALGLPPGRGLKAEVLTELDRIAAFLQLNKPRDYSDVSS